jgi:hypothetical protein
MVSEVSGSDIKSIGLVDEKERKTKSSVTSVSHNDKARSTSDEAIRIPICTRLRIDQFLETQTCFNTTVSPLDVSLLTFNVLPARRQSRYELAIFEKTLA